jgi:hypothetical protein
VDCLGGNEGFYYSSYEKPKGSELSAKTRLESTNYISINWEQLKKRIRSFWVQTRNTDT